MMAEIRKEIELLTETIKLVEKYKLLVGRIEELKKETNSVTRSEIVASLEREAYKSGNNVLIKLADKLRALPSGEAADSAGMSKLLFDVMQRVRDEGMLCRGNVAFIEFEKRAAALPSAQRADSEGVCDKIHCPKCHSVNVMEYAQYRGKYSCNKCAEVFEHTAALPTGEDKGVPCPDHIPDKPCEFMNAKGKLVCRKKPCMIQWAQQHPGAGEGKKGNPYRCGKCGGCLAYVNAPCVRCGDGMPSGEGKAQHTRDSSMKKGDKDVSR